VRDRRAHRRGVERRGVHDGFELSLESSDLLGEFVEFVLSVVAGREHELQRGPRTRRLAW
jgi:hypothetical protein